MIRNRLLRLAPILALCIAIPFTTTASGADAGDKAAFYTACSAADPAARFAAMADYLEKQPDGPWSDRVRTLLFGIAASEGWKESDRPLGEAFVADAVTREAGTFLAGEEDPDRMLLVSEALLRTGGPREQALELARRGGALAKTLERPATTSVSSWGRKKRERTARADYLTGLARMQAREWAGAEESFRKAQRVYLGDERFREEYGRVLESLGRDGGVPVEPRHLAMEAIGTDDPSIRAEKFEEYLRRFPAESQAVEIGIRLVETYTELPGREGEAVAVAARVADRTEDPEVLGALALLLADGGVGTEQAVDYGARGVSMLEEIIQDPDTEAEDLPSLQAALLMARDSYGWALFRDGRLDRSVEELRRAAVSEYPQVEYHHGVALYETGRSMDAVDALVRAYTGGVEEAKDRLDRIASESSAHRKMVDDGLDEAFENLRRRKLAKEEAWPSPDFTLTSIDGETITLSGLRDQVVVVSFWATWCDPCREELPRIAKVTKKYEDRGVRVLGVNTDRDFWLVRPFLDEYGVDMTTLLTAGEEEWEETARRFKVSAIPTHVIIDRKGTVRYLDQGYDGNGPLFEKVLAWRIERLLDER